MELALLVWLVDVIGSIKEVMGLSIFLIITVTLAFGLITLFMIDNTYNKEEKEQCKVRFKKYFIYKTLIALVLAQVLIPSEKTIQYMAGAYLIQTAYQSEFVNKASELGQKAVLNQLSKWAEDNPEVKTLLDTAAEVK